MQVLVIPDHRAPVVTQMLWFRVGAVDDPPGISGLAHFFEHMMFRGTKTVPGDQFSQTVAKNGGETNAFTSHDYTAYYEQIAKDRLPLVMRLEADRLANLDPVRCQCRRRSATWCWKSAACAWTTIRSP